MTNQTGGLGTVGLMPAYVIAFEPVGFLLSSMVCLFAQIMLMSNAKNRKPVLTLKDGEMVYRDITF